MKSKITKRLIFTNLLILIVTLFCFYVVSVYNLNSQAREQAEQQIFAESSTIIERNIAMQDIIASFDRENTPNIPSSPNDNKTPKPFNFNEDSFVFRAKIKQLAFIFIAPMIAMAKI